MSDRREGDGEPRLDDARRATTLGAVIQELLANVREKEVARVEHLRASLDREIFSWDNAPLAQVLQALYSVGRDLHLSQLRTSWLQRLLGRHAAQFERFAATSDRLRASAAAARAQIGAMHGGFPSHDQAARRLFDNLHKACKALGTELDRGVTLLQEMCNEIESQRRRGSVDPQLAVLAEQAQFHTEDFKRLQSIDAMVCELDVRGKGILDRRAALLQHLQSYMASNASEWVERVGALASEVRAGETRFLGLAKTIEAHDEAMKRLEHALDASGALQGEEQLMREQLEQLRATLAGRG